MGNTVRRSLSLPAGLAEEAEALAQAEGETLSAVIQDTLRQARIARREHEFRDVQGYWSGKARERGLFNDEKLRDYLAR